MVVENFQQPSSHPKLKNRHYSDLEAVVVFTHPSCPKTGFAATGSFPTWLRSADFACIGLNSKPTAVRTEAGTKTGEPPIALFIRCSVSQSAFQCK